MIDRFTSPAPRVPGDDENARAAEPAWTRATATMLVERYPGVTTEDERETTISASLHAKAPRVALYLGGVLHVVPLAEAEKLATKVRLLAHLACAAGAA